jgi:hypothetical protein
MSKTTFTRLSVIATPRSHASQIVKWENGVLYVRVTAPPIDDRANEAVVKLIADFLDLPKSSIYVAVGRASRLKSVTVRGLNGDELRARIERALKS